MRFILLLSANFLFFGLHGQTTFIIESLPNTTPLQDTIFMAGTFNNWKVNDNRYMLHPQLDGKYSITLPFDTGRIEFKFTRGSWQKVESGIKNEYTPNRIFVCGKNQKCYIKIQNWQDLGGVKQINYMVFLLFAIAFYGLFLLYFALRIQVKSGAFKPSFFLLNIALIVVLIGGVIYNQSNLIWQSPIGMLGIVMLFLWGPIVNHFLFSLEDNITSRFRYYEFIPVVIVIIITLLRFINFKPLDIYAIELNPGLTLGSCILLFLGLISTIVYHLYLYKRLKISIIGSYNVSRKALFRNVTFLISTFSLLVFMIVYIFLISGISMVVFNNFEPVLLSLSPILFIEFFYYWKYPEIFQLYEGLKLPNSRFEDYKFKKANYFLLEKEEVSKIPHQSLPDELVAELKFKLSLQMSDKKVFKDPKLNISSLSEFIDTKPHILSKLLNEQFNKSFRDFINEYRIKEFIELASSEKYKNYTLLALSYEVGFNSKSTFNLAFKKATNLSPREFLKNNKISLNG